MRMIINIEYVFLVIWYLLFAVGGSYYLYRSVISPLGLFGSVYVIVFMLLAIPLVDYRSIGPATFALLLLVGFVFSVSYIAVVRIFRKPLRKSAQAKQTRWDLSAFRTVLLISNVCSSVGILLQAYFFVRFFGSVSNYFNNLSNVYAMRVSGEALISSWIAYMGNVGYAAVFVAGQTLAVKGNLIKRPIIIWSILNVMALSILTMGRAAILWGGLFFVIGYLTMLVSCCGKAKRKMVVKNRLLIILLGGGIFAFINYLRQIRGKGDNFWSTIAPLRAYINLPYVGRDSFFWNALMSNYVYFTGSIPSLGYVMDHPDHANWVLRLLAPFARIIGKDIVRYSEFLSIPFEYNARSAIGELYLAFGFWGTLLVFLCVGAISAFLYEKLKAGTIHFNQLVLLSWLLIWLIWSIFFSLTRQGFFWISAFWLMGCNFVAQLLKSQFVRNTLPC